jgi:hypothetical protein
MDFGVSGSISKSVSNPVKPLIAFLKKFAQRDRNSRFKYALSGSFSAFGKYRIALLLSTILPPFSHAVMPL